MLQFLASNTINTPTITSNKHALYGINGGTLLHNWRDRWTSIAWPNAKPISPVVDSALDRTSQRGHTRPKSLTLNSTTSWPPVSIVLKCRQFLKALITYLPSTTSWLHQHMLDRTRRGINSAKLGKTKLGKSLQDLTDSMTWVVNPSFYQWTTTINLQREGIVGVTISRAN